MRERIERASRFSTKVDAPAVLGNVLRRWLYLVVSEASSWKAIAVIKAAR